MSGVDASVWELDPAWHNGQDCLSYDGDTPDEEHQKTTMLAQLMIQPGLESPAEAEAEAGPVGFLMVRRQSGQPYDETDRTFFLKFSYARVPR